MKSYSRKINQCGAAMNEYVLALAFLVPAFVLVAFLLFHRDQAGESDGAVVNRGNQSVEQVEGMVPCRDGGLKGQGLGCF